MINNGKFLQSRREEALEKNSISYHVYRFEESLTTDTVKSPLLIIRKQHDPRPTEYEGPKAARQQRYESRKSKKVIIFGADHNLADIMGAVAAESLEAL